MMEAATPAAPPAPPAPRSPWPDPRSLTARTLPLHAVLGTNRYAHLASAVDPVAIATAAADGFLFSTDHGFLATSGVAAALTLTDGLAGEATGAVVEWLGSVPTDDALQTSGSGPLAVGALPFLPGHRAELIVPSISVTVTGAGDGWVTVVGPAAAEHLLAPHQAIIDDPLVRQARALLQSATGPGTGPDGTASDPGSMSVELSPEPDGSTFESQVAEVLGLIAESEVTKVVLSRRVVATFDRPVDVARVLRRLHSLEPGTTVFADRRLQGTFVGASPELLVDRRGLQVRSHPLAGTGTIDPGTAPEAVFARLVGSSKERAEHAAVATAVVSALSPWCRSIAAPEVPTMVRLRTVVHLGTLITGLLEAGPGTDALSLAATVHPTPAVAGVPTSEALRIINRIEGDRRGPYAGPVGWVDSRGDGTFVVGIRSAALSGCRAVVDAGVGIVAGSDPRQELGETTAKMSTMLGALGAGDHTGGQR